MTDTHLSREAKTSISALYRIHLQYRRPWLDFWVGKIRWRRDRLPTPVFWPGESHGLFSPWGHKESDTTERLSFSLSRLVSQWPPSLPPTPLLQFKLLTVAIDTFWTHWSDHTPPCLKTRPWLPSILKGKPSSSAFSSGPASCSPSSCCLQEPPSSAIHAADSLRGFLLWSQLCLPTAPSSSSLWSAWQTLTHSSRIMLPKDCPTRWP